MERERIVSPIALELRDVDGSPSIRGVVIAEGFPSSGGRSECFVPGSIHWADDGIALKTSHDSKTVEVRAVPTREGAEIRIEAKANDAIRRAYESGSRNLSIEFRSEQESLRGTVRTITRALVEAVALCVHGEYVEAIAEVRRKKPRGLVFWL